MGLRQPLEGDLITERRLQGRIDDFEAAWVNSGQATVTLVDTEVRSKCFFCTENEYWPIAHDVTVTNEEDYQRVHARLQAELNDYQSAVTEADKSDQIWHQGGNQFGAGPYYTVQTKIEKVQNAEAMAWLGFGVDVTIKGPAAAYAVVSGVGAVRARYSGRSGVQEPEATGNAGDESSGPPPDGLYKNRRPYTRRSTEKNVWDTAPKGSVPEAKSCPDCGKDVFGNPYLGELRNTPEGWDVEHKVKWEMIRRELAARGATPQEYRDAYNDLNNTSLRCPSCNRADNQLPEE